MDVGSNDDAIVLMKDGKQITLGKDGDCPLPLINNQKTTEEMELKLFGPSGGCRKMQRRLIMYLLLYTLLL